VHKSEPLTDLKAAVAKVSAGQRHLSPFLARRIQYSGGIELYGTLTPREREVLLEIGRGKPNKMISRDLELSISTVRRHRENLMSKIDAHSASDVIGFCLRLGLIGGADHSL